MVHFSPQKASGHMMDIFISSNPVSVVGMYFHEAF